MPPEKSGYSPEQVVDRLKHIVVALLQVARDILARGEHAVAFGVDDGDSPKMGTPCSTKASIGAKLRNKAGFRSQL